MATWYLRVNADGTAPSSSVTPYWDSAQASIAVVSFGGQPRDGQQPDLRAVARRSRRRNWEALRKLADY